MNHKTASNDKFLSSKGTKTAPRRHNNRDVLKKIPVITGSLLFIWKKIFSIQVSETKKRRQEKLKRFSSSSVFGLLYPLSSNVLVYNQAECLLTRPLTSTKLFVSKSRLKVWKVLDLGGNFRIYQFWEFTAGCHPVAGFNLPQKCVIQSLVCCEGCDASLIWTPGLYYLPLSLCSMDRVGIQLLCTVFR